MLGWTPDIKEERPLRILCLGAHSDDIEIGCGGSLFEWVRERERAKRLDLQWVVFSGDRTRAQEARSSVDYWLRDVPEKELSLHSFRDGFFPDEWARIKEVFEQIRVNFDPDLIFTHYHADRHQDHRIINELTWNTFRNHVILEYEVPKYEGDLRTPNFYVPISAEAAHAKSEALIKYFNSQGVKHWFCEELFLGLMRIRGVECCASSGYAEGFHVRKAVAGL